ncbi:co-chaperone DjlA [Shewanella psychropiezotolerans]|uniref:Co-chaperone protein DjlA n=1 Tax=Shewanella psychropiezotolerans TaxID=2593655 RepID=A0ABX5X2N0_9GAMM|nr:MULTISPECIES: co-chaperone DjlA [Shewanella]MPY23527.1 co-chaperone DjlA [Shewanella sp. YLB-07]QDO85598.1 co-chaperone DjlA [Shewanella psychropiezotolerans]
MRIWGKFFGFAIGFMFGRIIGGLIGLWLGHLFDKKSAQLSGIIGKGANRQTLFFNTTFAVMGHVAKASGQVTENDIRIATMLMDQMQLKGEARQEAQRAFSEGKASDFDIKACLKTFRIISMGRKELLQMFLEIQIQTALSDGELDPNEHAILLTIAQELGYSRSQLDELLKRWQAEFNFHKGGNGSQTSIEDAYDLLGMAESSSDQEVKRAYRKLMNEHHPDKLVAKGLPEEMMELANRKAQDIQLAYDRVKSDRGMR